MSLLCILFGHKSREDDLSGGEYMEVREIGADGINRLHAWLYAKCPRCGTKYRAGACHLPSQKGGSHD